MHSPAVGSYGEALSYEQGTPVELRGKVSPSPDAPKLRVEGLRVGGLWGIRVLKSRIGV